MRDKYNEAFNEIVFAVARLLFGDSRATNAMLQALTKHALLDLGVWRVIKDLRTDNSGQIRREEEL